MKSFLETLLRIFSRSQMISTRLSCNLTRFKKTAPSLFKLVNFNLRFFARETVSEHTGERSLCENLKPKFLV